jgi:hypothetical protein
VILIRISVADPDSGSGAFFTPGSGIVGFPDPESRIRDPKPILVELGDNFLGKKSYKFLVNWLKNGFFTCSKIKKLNFVKFEATKICSCCWIRDKSQDPRFGINTPDPQH